jgi:hypothetical protein
MQPASRSQIMPVAVSVIVPLPQSTYRLALSKQGGSGRRAGAWSLSPACKPAVSCSAASVVDDGRQRTADMATIPTST